VLVFQKQPMMRKVLWCLAPISLFSIWLYGPRALAIGAVTFGLGILTEWLFERKKGGKVSEAVLVTCGLYALSMPPAAPLWIVAIGIVFGVAVAKGVYGGFGRNVFNPAIAGRLFVYISFASLLGSSFMPHGGFGASGLNPFAAPDAVSGATALASMKGGAYVDPLSLLFGLRDGSIGESPLILIIASGVYLIATKTASWRIIVAGLAAAALPAGALRLAGVPGALPIEALMAGSFPFVLVFMATDPVSAPKKKGPQYFYGALIGMATVAIRSFSGFPEGTSFAVLFGNSFASFLDELAARRAEAKKAKAAASAPAPASPGTAEAKEARV
jgi:Na+-transporting NADH:ubiquinone oxidoreductase subunit B